MTDCTWGKCLEGGAKATGYAAQANSQLAGMLSSGATSISANFTASDAIVANSAPGTTPTIPSGKNYNTVA